MLYAALLCVLAAQDLEIYTADAAITASSSSGGKYAPESALDGSSGTRWASGGKAPLPQWLEIRLNTPSVVDTVLVNIPIDDLYAEWKEVELTFSAGDPVRQTLAPGVRDARFEFEPRTVEWVRVSVLSVYEERTYVGVFDLTVANDPAKVLGKTLKGAAPLTPEMIEVRGRAEHPCVNVTPVDVEAARKRVATYEWARIQRDQIVADAEKWLRESDDYWLAFLPKPGACYAYGFTGDPTTGESFGTWASARCTWDRPGTVANSKGVVFPNEDYPDDGTGYIAPDGRKHYFIGIWNAWVTEQWTLNALPALSQAYLLTGDVRYAERGVLFLDALASIYAESTSGSWDYPSNPPSGRFARPWYQVARNLVKYVDYYDFLHSAPSMNRPSLRPGMACRENIEKYMLLDGAQYCYEHTFAGALHNGHADYMRGALAVGCVLDVPEYVRNAVEGPFSILAMLANNIDRDGRYYETSLGYAIHARMLYLTFADPLYNLRSAEYPRGINLYDDPKMQASLLLPELQVELAGRRPNFGDSAPEVGYKPMPEQPFSQTDYGFLERLCARATDPAKHAEFAGALNHLARGDVERLRRAAKNDWLLWHAAEPTDAAPALPPDIEYRVSGSWVAGMKGMAMLRAGDQAALLRFGPSLNHGDPDDLGLLYYANGYEPTHDIGYGLGSTHVHCGWASSTVSHCLVTVDESNQFGGAGSGGSLEFFGDLPSVRLVQATSELSYSAQEVSEYRRLVAVMADGKYLVDLFRVTGGHQHDYSFGSIGTDVEPFGVPELTAREGSLAEGVAWGESIGNDGDIKGYPNKPYWNPPPGNGYGFFYNVRTGPPEPVWGGTWSIKGSVPTRFRMHVLGNSCEAVFADAPGLYPTYPRAGFVIARRRNSADEEPLRSTFLAVYEPFRTQGLAYDFDREDLIAGLADATAETAPIDTLGVLLLKGKAPGDTMTFRLHIDKPLAGHLTLHAAKAASYGKCQVEWDGEPVGPVVDLFADPYADAAMSSASFEIGPVDTAPGEHTFTVRTVESNNYYVAVGGLSFGTQETGPQPEPVLKAVRALGESIAEAVRADGTVDVVMAGSGRAASALGDVVFEGDFAYLSGKEGTPVRAEVLGCSRLDVGGKTMDAGPAAFEATVVSVDMDERSVVFDKPVPEGCERLVAVFANPKYSRSTAYHVHHAEESRLYLQACSLSLGEGRVYAIAGTDTLLSDVPHEYARMVKSSGTTRFFQGKRILGASGNETRAEDITPGAPLRIRVEDALQFEVGERFQCADIGPGDVVRIALPRVIPATE